MQQTVCKLCLSEFFKHHLSSGMQLVPETKIFIRRRVCGSLSMQVRVSVQRFVVPSPCVKLRPLLEAVCESAVQNRVTVSHRAARCHALPSLKSSQKGQLRNSGCVGVRVLALQRGLRVLDHGIVMLVLLSASIGNVKKCAAAFCNPLL